MLKTCVICGKQFEGKGTSSHCKGPHYKECAVCGKLFEWDYKHPKDCCSKECSVSLRKLSISSQVKVCELCGNKFHPKNNTQRYCEADHFSLCPICGNAVKITDGPNISRCCSTKCATELRRRTCFERYGVDVISKSDSVRDKLRVSFLMSADSRKKTCLEKWGVDNPSKHTQIKLKISRRIRSDECKLQTRSTNQKRYGVDFPMQSKSVASKYSETIQNRYGIPYYCMSDACRMSQGDIISSANRKLGKLLSDKGLKYTFEYRIQDKSYDICIPDKNILLEINPTYTHNAVGNHWGCGLPIDYHSSKTQLALDNGFRCIHIWDWDNLDKVMSLLCSKSSVPARKCKIKLIDSNTASEFEDMHHLQGKVSKQMVCLGLYFDGSLVEVMTFGSPRYNSKFEWELLRLCTSSDYVVIGGSLRLWSYFKENYHPKSVVSYCDRSKFTGDIYLKLHMTLDEITSPNKIWSKGSDMITNNLLLQRGYDQLFGTNYGKGSSNEVLMLENGWLPVYDCGQSRYVWFENI